MSASETQTTVACACVRVCVCVHVCSCVCACVLVRVSACACVTGGTDGGREGGGEIILKYKIIRPSASTRGFAVTLTFRSGSDDLAFL